MYLHFCVEIIELRKSDEISSDQNSKLHSFSLALFTLAAVALMLHSNPQLVHLGKVELNEIDRILNL